MKSAKWLTIIILVVILVIILFYPHKTGNTEIGVRTMKFNFFGLLGKTGVVDKVYQPASMYFFPAVFNDWHTFDKALMNLEMTYSPERGDIRKRDDLLFKTIDGNDISLDVIITYRIIPEKAPYILQYVARNMTELKDNIMRTIGRARSRDIFGELTTEDFYVSAKRTEKSERAKKILNDILNPYGIMVERVSTKDYRFNKAYQQAIEAKKVADQMVEKNRSATRAAYEEYQKKLQDAIGEVNKLVARSDGEYEKSKIKADAYFEQQKLIAEAIKKEGEADAQGITKMNEALVGAGGEVMVKMKIAEALKDKKIILIPTSGAGGVSLKTLNVNELLKLYGMRDLSQQK